MTLECSSCYGWPKSQECFALRRLARSRYVGSNPLKRILFTSINGGRILAASLVLLMTGTLNYCAGFLLRGRSQEHGPCCSGLVEPGWRHDHGVSGVRTKRSLGIEGLMVMVMVVLMMMRRGRRGWRRAEEGRGRGEDDWGWPGVLHSCWRWFAGSPVDHMKDLKISWSL